MSGFVATLRLAAAVACLSCRDTSPVGAAGGARPPGEPAPPARDNSPVQTDSVKYTLRHVGNTYIARALASYTNRTAAPVFFARCMPTDQGPIYSLARTDADSTAQLFLGIAWACVGGVPAGVVPPGSLLSFEIPLVSSDSPDANPPIQPAWRTGRLRVALILCANAPATPGSCATLPVAERQSNAFDVRLPSP